MAGAVRQYVAQTMFDSQLTLSREMENRFEVCVATASRPNE